MKKKSMELESIKIQKEKLLNRQEEIFQGLIKIIENKEKEIESLKQENYKLKVSVDIMKSEIKNKDYIIEKLKEQKLKVKNEDSISKYINMLKERFLSENPETFKKFITAKKNYTGNNEVIEKILEERIDEKRVSESEAKTLLLISFFYGFHLELIKKMII